MQSNPLAQSNPFTQNPIQSSRKCPQSKTPLMVFFLQFLDFIEKLPTANQHNLQECAQCARWGTSRTWRRRSRSRWWPTTPPPPPSPSSPQDHPTLPSPRSVSLLSFSLGSIFYISHPLSPFFQLVPFPAPRAPSPSIGSPLHFPSPLFHRGSIVNWAPAHTTCESPSHPDLRPWPRPMEPVCARSRHPSTLPQDLWSPYTKQAPQPRPRETSRHLLFNHLQLGDMRFITCTHGTNAPRSHPP